MMIARTGQPGGFRTRLLLGYADSAHAALWARHFRRRGWEVHQIGCSLEARRLANVLDPELIILDTELPAETGWLTAAKLLLERPGQKIILVGPERTSEQENFASFIGAAGFFSRQEMPAMAPDILNALLVA